MRFSTFTCFALAAATLLQPVISGSVQVEPNTPSFAIDESVVLVRETLSTASDGGEGYVVSGLMKSLFSWSAVTRWLYDLLHFTHAQEFFWDKVTELGPKFQSHTDGLFHYASELYPSEKIAEFKVSAYNIASTTTTLQKVIRGVAEQRGIPLDSVKTELGDVFNVIFEELKEKFPPPDEAPSHENRTAMIKTALDRVEEGFLQFAVKHGVDEESLKSHTGPLKSHVQLIVVTIGDLVEQHPQLAITLLVAAVVVVLPELWLLRQVLRMFGFGPLGPVKGGVAAWLQRWLFGPAVPKGGWFAMFQHLAMKAVKL